MQASEIKNVIARGESENVELKKSLRSEHDALKTAAAFANADGGWFLFGVKDIPEYDLEAVREAIANAVAHRDYRAHEPIQLRLFDDRLEIANPGPLPDDLTIEGILADGVIRARNPVLAQVLLDSGISI